MRLLIEGIGSIGQRHYKNARLLGHEVAVIRSTSSRRPFVDKFLSDEEAKGNDVRIFFDLSSAIKEFSPEAIVIANPNHMHLASAKAAVAEGLHVLIEKPVHINLSGLTELSHLVTEKNVIAMVGYNYRFHPLLNRIKEVLDRDQLGDILSAQVEVGENIEDWHPWEDYRDTYAPWKETGGGALLCFSHDIDYLYWLLGSPKEIFAVGGKLTPLDGDAEDLVQSVWKLESGGVATLQIDYWQRPKVRRLKLIGTKGALEWDAYGALSIWSHSGEDKKVHLVPEDFERNTMFIDELRHFEQCISHKSKPHVPLEDAIEVVRIIEDMKHRLV